MSYKNEKEDEYGVGGETITAEFLIRAIATARKKKRTPLVARYCVNGHTKQMLINDWMIYIEEYGNNFESRNSWSYFLSETAQNFAEIYNDIVIDGVFLDFRDVET